MLRVKLTQEWESNWLKYLSVTHFTRSNNNSVSNSTFKVKTTQFFLSVHWEKNWVILSKKNSIKFYFRQWLKFSTILGSKWPNFLLRCTKRKNWVIWVTARIFWSKWLNFFSQCTERKIESFWPKKIRIKFYFRQWLKFSTILGSKWLNFFSWCTEQKN